MPWGIAAGAAISAIGGSMQAGAATDAANKNAAAAKAAGDAQMAATSPYSLQSGIGNTSYYQSPNGLNNRATQTLSPTYQSLQNNLFGGSSQYLGNAQQGQVPSYLQSALGQYQNSMPNWATGVNPSTQGINPSLAGPQGYANQLNGQQMPGQQMGNIDGVSGGVSALLGQYQNYAANPNQVSNNGLGNSFNGASSGMLGALGSFDPNQSAQNYTNLLRQQATPGNQLATNNLSQELFNSGRLGSTGGATLMGQQSLAQSQADTGMQIAGQQYAQQQQQGLVGMAGQLGQTGTGMNNATAGLNSQLQAQALSNYGNLGNLGIGANQAGYAQNASQYGLQNQQYQNAFNNSMGMNDTAFSRSMGLNNTDYTRGMDQSNTQYARQMGAAQQGFQNSQANFTGAMNYNNQQYNMGMGMMNSGMGIDQALNNQVMQGAQLGAMRNTGGITTGLQGQIGANNATGAANAGMIGSYTNALAGVAGGYDWGSLFGGSGQTGQNYTSKDGYTSTQNVGP